MNILISVKKNAHHPTNKSELSKWARENLSLLLRHHQLSPNVEIQNHHFLVNNPDWSVSLSHNEGYTACALAKRSEYDSIGIDIEDSERPFDMRVNKFLLNSTDHEMWQKKGLLTWVIKEACFKALSPFYLEQAQIKPLVLTDIILTSENTFGVKDQKKIIGEFRVVDNNEYYCSDLSNKLIVVIAGIRKWEREDSHSSNTWPS